MSDQVSILVRQNRNVVGRLSLGTFRFEYEYEIEYEYEFLISKQSPPLNPNFSLLLTSRSGDCRGKIDVTSDHLKHANRIWNVVLVLKSKGPYYLLIIW